MVKSMEVRYDMLRPARRRRLLHMARQTDKGLTSTPLFKQSTRDSGVGRPKKRYLLPRATNQSLHFAGYRFS